jgi:ATP-binding cassette subfamily B protein
MIAALRKMLAMVKHPGRYTAGLILIGIVSASMNIFIGLAFKLFINAAESASWEALYQSLALFLTAVAFMLVIMPLGYWFYETAVVHSTANLRRQVFQRSLRLTASWLEKRHSGDLTSRATTDVHTAEQAYSTNIVNLVEITMAGIGSMAAMLFVDWKLGLGLVAFGAIRVWINALIARPLGRAADKVQSTLGTVTERVSDIANGNHVIRLYNYQQPAQKKFQQHNEQAVQDGMNRVKYAAVSNFFNNFTGHLSFIGLIMLGGWFIIQGWYDLGTLMFFVQLQNGVNQLFGALGMFITRLQTSLAGGKRVLEVIEQDPEPERLTQPCPAAADGAVTLENVSFAYREDENPVLKDISLKVQEGETVALVGPSGGGKSTLFKLLLGYYPPHSGAISLLGKGLEELTLAELRDLSALVPQTPYLFTGTIAENIAFGRPGASQQEIEAAAKAANAHDFINQFPEGYNTVVGERGSRMSGGQRQRIAIARAILKNAPILLLDEATSSLDNESEEQVQLALKELMKGRTTLVIAHRLSTIRDADRIVVIAGGEVAEEGKHQELLSQDGIYKRLHDMQFAEDLPSAG